MGSYGRVALEKCRTKDISFIEKLRKRTENRCRNFTTFIFHNPFQSWPILTSLLCFWYNLSLLTIFYHTVLYRIWIRNQPIISTVYVYNVSVDFLFSSPSVLLRMAFADWLRYSISILVVIKMTAASWHFRNACEKDLDKVFNDQ